MIRPVEVHSEALSGHFVIYLGLGVYGHGTRLHSLHTNRFTDMRWPWKNMTA